MIYEVSGTFLFFFFRYEGPFSPSIKIFRPFLNSDSKISVFNLSTRKVKLIEVIYIVHVIIEIKTIMIYYILYYDI